ncbi:MAG: glycosyltransferase [Phycisphaerales bacterium]|nr:MAG: glycosyltransferase [Phycisphaerales bacterium]
MAGPIRVILWQGAVPTYRAPVWRMLSEHPDIDLLLLRGQTPDQRSVEVPGVRVEPVRLVRLPLGLDMYPSQWVRPRVGEADVAIVPWSSRSLSALWCISRCRRLGIGVVAWGHGAGKQSSSWRDRLRNAIGRRADVTMVYSRGVADQLTAGGGFDPARVRVAANSLDTRLARAARSAWSDESRLNAFRVEQRLDGPVILYVSRLIPSKRPELVVEVLAALRERHRGLKAVLIGDGPQREIVMRTADRLGVGDAVLLPGALFEEEQLAPYFCAADVFCYPRSIGLSLQHAFAYGLPVVTDDDAVSHGPEVEALVHEKNGLIYQRGDVGAMIEAVDRLLCDPALRARCREGAMEVIDPANPESFTAERMIEGFVGAIRAAYASAASRRGLRSGA